MNRRSGVTLIEVLAAIFIMAIGCLALLTLFPLGALTMGQALKDDRCINCVQCANGIANAYNLRTKDPNVNAAMAQDYNGNAFPVGYTGPSSPVYVDPFYQPLSNRLDSPPGTAGIWRVSPARTNDNPAGSWPAIPITLMQSQYFSLLDDITFASNGIPDVSSGNVNRGGVFTWAYMLQTPNTALNQVDMAVVVYRGRPTTVPDLETSYVYDSTLNPPNLANNYVGSNSVVITYNPQQKPPIRRGGWMLECSVYPQPAPGNTTIPIQNSAFYRIVNVDDNTATNQMTLELQAPLSSPISGANPTRMVYMPYVQEVFDRSVYR